MDDPRVEWRTRRPAPALASAIERYVGYRVVGYGPGVHRGLPSRHMTLIVSIGAPIDVVAQADAGQAPRAYRCPVGGLQASPALIAYDGDQEGVAVELTPIGCRAVLGLPARALWNASLELDELAGPLARELWERLQAQSTWPERFDVCDEVLGRLLRDDPLEPALRRSWQLIVESAGTMTIADLSRRVGWSRQHLARRFADEFGLSPKRAARVVRFERARRMLEARSLPIAGVAAACGYYDQAHLTRDFAELAGCSPARLLADDLPSVQDGVELDAPACAP